MTEEFELTAAEIYTLNKASLAEALVDHVAGLDRPHAKLIVESLTLNSSPSIWKG